MIVNVLLATDIHGGIGLNGDIPWKRTPFANADLAHFKSITIDSALIMGRGTWMSLGERPLLNRINIVVTSDPKQSSNNLRFVDTLDAAYLWCASMNIHSIAIIGGAQIYKEVFERKMWNYIYITKIPHNYNCDVFVKLPTNMRVVKTISLDHLYYQYRDIVVKYEIDNSATYLSLPSRFIFTQEVSDDDSYINLAESIMSANTVKANRTAINCLSVVGGRIEMSLYQDEKRIIPLLLSRSIPFSIVFHELMWFLKGSTDTSYLKEHGIAIWDANSTRDYLDMIGLQKYKEGELGPIYGFQWRNFGGEYDGTTCGVDQITNLLYNIKKDPMSRRHVVSAWSPAQIGDMALPPCHMMFQVVIDFDLRLNVVVTQRSGDMFLGIPTNIASYSLLAHFLSLLTGYRPGKIVINIGDAHIYSNHISQLQKQILGAIYVTTKTHPEIQFTSESDWQDMNIDTFITKMTTNHIKIIDYYPYSKIDGVMAV